MTRTEHAHFKVATLRAGFVGAAMATTLLAGLAALPAAAGPSPAESPTRPPTGAGSSKDATVNVRCTPVDPGGYDAMQDYVDTLIWWHYHPDWRVD
jgi:hypothetical protein